jgi:3-hydroxymyristoyl/3-hydroxydecanoyl-(acyl carrier protein) dehydratase
LDLPHRFPFRWIEGARDGRALAVFSANSTWLRGAAPVPAAFLAELVAQAAAVLLADPAADPADPRQRWLAGIDRLEMHRTVRAGDLLEISVLAGRRFGNAMQVEGAISTGGEKVADVVLLLV